MLEMIDIGVQNVVAHTKWLYKLVDLEDKIFWSIDMKGFSVNEREIRLLSF